MSVRRTRRKKQPILKTCLEMANKKEHLEDFALMVHLANLHGHRNDLFLETAYRAAAMGRSVLYAVRDSATGLVLRSNAGSVLGIKNWVSRRTKSDGTLHVEQWCIVHNFPYSRRITGTWKQLVAHLPVDDNNRYVFQAAAARIEAVEVRNVPQVVVPLAGASAAAIGWQLRWSASKWPAADKFSPLNPPEESANAPPPEVEPAPNP